MISWIMYVIAYKLILKDYMLLAVEPLIWELEERRRTGLMAKVLLAWYYRQEQKRR